MERLVRHWLALATGPNRRLPQWPFSPDDATGGARFASRKGWIAAGPVRDEAESAAGLSFWIVTEPGLAEARFDGELALIAAATPPAAPEPEPEPDARNDAWRPAPGATHAAIVAAKMERDD